MNICNGIYMRKIRLNIFENKLEKWDEASTCE